MVGGYFVSHWDGAFCGVACIVSLLIGVIVLVMLVCVMACVVYVSNSIQSEILDHCLSCVHFLRERVFV